jgi:hypothetical protein
MEWDSIKMGQKFLRQANALHPEEARHEGRFEDELAIQDLFYECYVTSFSRDKLIEQLKASVEGNVKIPEELPDDFNEQKYRKAYSKQAGIVLGELTSK